MREILDRLERDCRLTATEYVQLLSNRSENLAAELSRRADRVRRKHFGTELFLRAVLDISSICPRTCKSCPVAFGTECNRFRLRPREILDRCEELYGLETGGLVLRSGDDHFYTDRILCDLLEKLGHSCPGWSVTLSLGERSRESFEALYNAGAEGCILLQETADRARYEDTHPAELSFDRRLHRLNDLMEIGFCTGCGFVIGAEGQTDELLARELKFMEEFQPHAVELAVLEADPLLTGMLLAILRLMLPQSLITAPTGAEEEILAGANVLLCGGSGGPGPLCGCVQTHAPDTPQDIAALRRRMAAIGFEITTAPCVWRG